MQAFGRLILVSALAGVSGCGFFKNGDRCPAGPGLQTLPLRGDQLPDKTLAFTFDGEPGAVAVAIGDYLYANNIGAAFFVRGNAAADHGPAMQALKNRGHLLGNRGYVSGGPAAAKDPVTDVRKTDELIAPFVSGNMFLLRTVSETLAQPLAEKLNTAGLTRYVGPIGWDFGSGNADYVDDETCWAKNENVDDCAQGYLAAIRVKKRGIVRLHADDPRSQQVVRTIYVKMTEEGFSFVRLDAIATIRIALERSGATPGQVGGAAGCNEY